MLPKEGATGVVGHVDDLVQGEAPELHVQVDELHHDARRCRPRWREYFGEAPANPKACALTAAAGFCEQFHATDAAFAKQLYYWTTPTQDCLDGSGRRLHRLHAVDDGLERHAGRRDLTVGAPDRRAGPAPPTPANGAGRRRVAAMLLDRHPRVQLGRLLGAPMLWLVVIYLGSLAALLLTSLYTTNDFTGNLVKTVSLTNFKDLVTDPTFRTVTLRTIGIALAVTVIDLVLALPIAFFMAKVASRRTRRALAVAIVLPAVGQLPGQGLLLARHPRPVRRGAEEERRLARPASA